MQKTIVVELPERNERDFVFSAESALNQAQSYGTITSWTWGDPQGNGQPVTNPETSASGILTSVREKLAEGLEDLADTLRN